MQLEECMGWTLQMVTKTVAAMAQTVFCADLQDNIELQSRLMQSVLDAETETAAFIEQFGLQELNLAAVRTCKLQFLEWNQKYKKSSHTATILTRLNKPYNWRSSRLAKNYHC